MWIHRATMALLYFSTVALVLIALVKIVVLIR